jgi:hypothetical protein
MLDGMCAKYCAETVFDEWNVIGIACNAIFVHAPSLGFGQSSRGDINSNCSVVGGGINESDSFTISTTYVENIVRWIGSNSP